MPVRVDDEQVGAAAKASDRGYIAAHLAVTVVALIGVLVVARLVRRPAAIVSETTEAAGTTEADVTEVEVDEHR